MSNQHRIRIEQDGFGLEVQFNQRGDRWHQKVFAVSEQAELTLLESVEGSADESWPPSPALQEVDMHELGKGQAALAVGMAGTSHWSASCSIEKTDEDRALIKTDLACLVKELPALDQPNNRPKIGSTYSVKLSASNVEKHANGLCLNGDGFQVLLSPLENTQLLVEEDPQTKKSSVLLAPVVVGNHFPQTIRWAFGLQIRQF